MALDVLEDEVTRRAVEGVEEPAGWYKGKSGGTVRRYSDTLLIFRLKDDLLERIARGEHPMSVLASAINRGVSRKELGLLPAKDK